MKQRKVLSILALVVVLVVLAVVLVRSESFSTMFPGQPNVRLVDFPRLGCKEITKEDLIKYYGSEEILREILLSKGLHYNTDLDNNSALIADFLSGETGHLKPLFSKTC